MKKIILGLTFLLSFSASASLIVDTSLWTVERSPARNSTGSSWTSVGGNQAVQNLNSYGTLVSDFTISGDFNFTGFMNPTIVGFNDNDVLGVVFGWQDYQNHYRLGWEQGGYNDISGASGMFLIEEVSGVSTILFQQEIFWNDNTEYDFTVGRNANDISFSLNGINQTFTNTSFMSGNVGFYTESQTAIFGGLASAPRPPSVPEPSTLVIFALGMIGLASRRYKKQS